MSKLLIVQAEIQLIHIPTFSSKHLQLVFIFHRFHNQSASFTEKKEVREREATNKEDVLNNGCC